MVEGHRGGHNGWLEGAGIELLPAQFQVRPLCENLRLNSEVGLHGLLVSAVRDPQGLVLVYLKFVKMGGHLGEPYGSGMFKDVAPNGLMSPQMFPVKKRQLN